MTRLAALFIVALAAAVIITACGGSGDDGPSLNATETAAGLEATRAGLRADLENYGANIGSLPDDIREDLLASCWELQSFAADDAVDDICSAVERAIVNADPGLIALVLNELNALVPE